MCWLDLKYLSKIEKERKMTKHEKDEDSIDFVIKFIVYDYTSLGIMVQE